MQQHITYYSYLVASIIILYVILTVSKFHNKGYCALEVTYPMEMVNRQWLSSA
jgi:hypothetical protein